MANQLETPWVSEAGDRFLPKIYHDADIYEQEMEKIFGRSWQFVGHVSQIPKSGDFFLSRIGEEKVIVIRGTDESVRVVLNMCRHKGHLVCRAERGNTKLFICPYHAWSYGIDGELAQAPMTSELAPQLNKADFGLIPVPRVETYHGLIFANFDADAPPLETSMGDLRFYLDTFVGRRGVDLEMIGGVQKWEVDCNWKIGPEGMGGDYYHVAAAHGSVFSTDPALRDAIKVMADPSKAHNVALEGGHGFNMVILPEGLPEEAYYPVEGRFLDMPGVREYFAGIQAEAEELLGAERSRLRITTGTMFPNLSFSPGIFTLRLILPKGPDRIENWCWVFGYSDMPAEVRAVIRTAYLAVFGPDGCLEPDDADAWNQVSDGTRTRQGKNVPLFAGLGLGQEMPSGSLPGAHFHPLSEGTARGFFRQWQSQMSGGASV